ncbi:uncharacterized protein TRIADDRAFT_54807 [Trichoplax adhaerens]|uniref:Uncharacterized protein n=1 Tax=Trichoplax adhaerens TaxID=10228 RepID=B3RT20_TRIAD|nr:predicted protein [Trichoplax adhaerens]EDV27150.1 predicted protein [Trichoplax adhaerens]|eukprot:XP_002111146.1 predicted protein [Trichoplax adhaerens]
MADNWRGETFKPNDACAMLAETRVPWFDAHVHKNPPGPDLMAWCMEIVEPCTQYSIGQQVNTAHYTRGGVVSRRMAVRGSNVDAGDRQGLLTDDDDHCKSWKGEKDLTMIMNYNHYGHGGKQQKKQKPTIFFTHFTICYACNRMPYYAKL